ITEWYFVSYQLLFLFWPWDFELRFQLAVAPLAALYLWRGALPFFRWVQRTPRAAGAIGCMVAGFGMLSSTVWGWRVAHPRAVICIGVWLLAGCLSAVILAGGPELIRKLTLLSDRDVSFRRVRLSRAQMAGALVMTCL